LHDPTRKNNHQPTLPIMCVHKKERKGETHKQPQPQQQQQQQQQQQSNQKKRMSNNNDNSSRTLLHNALNDEEMTDNEILSIIDSNPVAVQRRNDDGDYPLHIACRRKKNNSNSCTSFNSISTSVNSIIDNNDSHMEQQQDDNADDSYNNLNDDNNHCQHSLMVGSPIIVKKLISLNPRAVMQRSPRDGQHPIKFLFQSKYTINTQ
jgi:hypothetical protein